ncbi:DUF3291 domain-containing protein [Streptosporangium amethystogenes]|uniref:DUF3291 domain-containing protein n=1 Tax=Streptosporangium amethystogenes TaxID=2002 RepID=UPI0004C7DFAE|nr:DUF3291 domain-containing protein [Streptosporangium amethystogenes]
MPTIPWIATNTPETGSTMVVMASRLEVRSLRHVPGFLLASLALWRQALKSPGAVGVSLKAELFKRTFWTLSAWKGQADIRSYASTEPHRSVMRRKRAVMHESTFVFWDAPAGRSPIGWEEAQERIAKERA